MNRSILSLTALSAIAYTSAAPAFILNDTRRAGPLDDNYTGLGLLNADAGGTEIGAPNSDVDLTKKPDTVVAKGETVRDGTEGNAQHVAAAASAAAPGTEALSANKDAGDLGGQAKTVIGDPAAGSEQQTQQV